MSTQISFAMSSQSSSSVENQDEVCSCASYSSGWERSSTTDYWESTSEYEEELVEVERFEQPKRTGKSTLFDMEYKCELVVLPNPYQRANADPKTIPVEKQEEIPVQPEETPILNPWKPIDKKTSPQESQDPWKFLEEMNKPVEKERPVREPRREERRKTISRPIDNSNTNKLCKYKDECRMNKNNNCSMVHALAAWKPRICRFNNSCKRKHSCGYYHTDTSMADYLRVMINIPETIYAKNSSLYEKYL